MIAWLSQSLIPKLNPGDIIIIDNATFHKGETIQKILEFAGCELWYLPAYSPDLNKIEREMCRGNLGLQNRAVENWWSVLKNWMKQMLPEERNSQRMCRCCF